MSMCLRSKFQVSSITLTSFRQKGKGGGGNFTPLPPHTPENEPLKRPPRLRLSNLIKNRLQYRCFPVKFAKYLRTLSLTNHVRWLLVTFREI